VTSLRAHARAGVAAQTFATGHAGRALQYAELSRIETAQMRDLIVQRLFGCLLLRNRSCWPHRTTPLLTPCIRNTVDALVLAVCRDKSEAELLAHDSSEEAAEERR
jgi:hypothetical protein